MSFDKMTKEEQLAAAIKGGSTKPKKPRGFAAMSPERRREIQSKGGKNSPGFAAMTPERHREIAKKGGSVRRKS